MVNTNNTKFTFNKKGLALSLACVGLLATAGNAGIEGTGVSAVNGSTTNYNVTVSKLTSNLTITGKDNVLGFTSGGGMVISGSGVSFITGTGGGNLKELNLFNASGSNTLILQKTTLGINVDTTTMNIGSGAKTFTISGGGTLKFGKNTFNEVNLNSVTFSSGGGTITNAGTITDMVINEFVNSAKKTETIAFKNDSAITTLTNNANITGSGAGVNVSGSITLDLGKVGTFIQNGTLKNITINSGTIGTFTNTANIDNSTIKVNVNDFNNSGSITTAASSDIKVSNSFNNASGADFKLAGTITLQGAADAKDAKTTFDNAGLFSGGTISIVNNVLEFNNATTGTINKSTISGAGAILTFKNEGMITKLDIKNTAYIKDVFNNTGKIENSTIKVGKNTTNLATTFTNAGEISSDGTAENTLAVNAKDFTNEKTIKFVSGSITIAADNFTNAKDALIDIDSDDSNALKITASKKFDNLGTIKGTSGDATTLTGTITLKTDADSERNATFAGTNSGLIQVNTISFSGFHKSFENSGIISGGNISGASSSAEILTFTNTADGAIKGSTIKIGIANFNNLGSVTTGNSSAINIYNSFKNAEKADFKLTGILTLEGDARDSKTTFDNAGLFSGGTIKIVENVLTFNNAATGEIKGTEISGAGTIQTLTNAGVMSVKANKANVAAFKNTKEFTLTGGTINVLNSFNNEEKATLTTSTNNGTIQLGNGKNANTTETTFVNAGTIDGKGKLTISQSGGWVKSFTNTGLIDKTTITSGGANGIVTFTNTGTIDNSTLQVNVVNFNNLEGGLIDFRNTASNSINLSGALDKTASFNNAGTIDNLASAIGVNTDVKNVSFTNSGSIYQVAGATTEVLSLKGASNLDFNNSGTIALAGTNTSAAITATTAGAKANIINTGAITLGNGGAHMDLTKITAAKDAPFVVKEWHLSNIGSADAYNGKYTSDGSDKIVVKGFSGGITTGTSNLRFDKGSIVIDPIKNPKMVSGQPYLLDRIVVRETGVAVEEIHKDDGTAGASYNNLIAAAYDLNKDTNTYTLKAGVEDPRLVTIDTIRSSDPVFEIYGVDAYASDGKVGEVITVSGATTTRKGDGIIDSFQVGVNASKSAGAAVVQSAVNNSITRNAFVGNVINTAVNSALASLNNLNRVSYNDEEVDFSELEKYAAVSSDVTDQTYAKDSNVYVMPYYRSTSVDLATNDSLDADTYGIVLGGNKNLGNAGVIGLFLGYENSDGSADKIDTEDDTFFGGINYYKTLGGTSSYDYFVKGMARLAKTSTDVTTKVNSGTSSADTFSYGVEANVGMNFYNGIHTFTPEVGLSYDRVSVDGFIQSNGLSNDDQDINLVIGKVGINWLAQFTESLSTNVGVGIRYNFNDDFDANIGTGNQRYSATTDLGDFYYYVNLGVNYAITQNWELGVMYNGDFSSDASSHSGFVKLGYWW